MIIRNIVDSLQTHKTLRYTTRQLSRITGIVVHHTTGSVTSLGTSPAGIARFHVEIRRWPGIGYHFFIDVDGTIYQTNRLTTVSYHAGTPNTATIGVVLRGDFSTVHPTAQQKHSLVELLRYLSTHPEYQVSLIAGHGKYPRATASNCPGRTWAAWLPGIIQQAEQSSGPPPIEEPEPEEQMNLALKVVRGCNIRSSPSTGARIAGWRNQDETVIPLELRVVSPSSVWVRDEKGWSAVVHNSLVYMDGE
ncbi:MAG TPA: peptidoglycan recognition family protein [Dissulfurispiraceae bacterium]|nr:peptidoglycan recognition family protein [Dissulfurispiraceae bacterium]